MSVNRKSAPQQEVVHIDRTGQWGNIEYRHRLACGHYETRKRPARTPTIACTWCVVAEEKGKELRALATPVMPVVTPVDDIWDFYDDVSTTEVEVARMRSNIASVVGCDQESVEIVWSFSEEGDIRLNYVTIFLDARQAEALAKRAQAK